MDHVVLPRLSCRAVQVTIGVVCGALLGCGEVDRFSEEVIEGEDVAVHWLEEPEQHWRGEVQFTLGAASGEGPELFSEISGLALDLSGRIIVVDRHSHEVRIFGPTGDFQFAFGGRGSGPGEMLEPCCVSFDPTGRLWVRDRGNGRLNVYALEATEAQYVQQVRSVPGMGLFGEPPIFLNGDTIVDVSAVVDGRAGYNRISRNEITMDGTITRVMEVPPPPPDRAPTLHGATRPSLFSGGSGTTGGYLVLPAYAPRHLVAHSPTGDWAEIITSDYIIRWYNRRGELQRVIAADVEPGPVLTPSQRAFQARQIERRGRIPGFDNPDRRQPLQGIFFDSEGRLWVQRSTANGLARGDIIAQSGTYLASVEWPRTVELRQGYIQGRTAIGIATDSLGVMRAVQLQFEETEGGMRGQKGVSDPSGLKE